MGKRAAIAGATILFLLAAGNCFGQQFAGERPWHKKWIVSALALTAANLLDMRSSAGQMEANPLLSNSQGQLSTGRAVAFKAVASGSLLLFETYLIHKRPEIAKTSTITNFVSAAALTGVAIRNQRLR